MSTRSLRRRLAIPAALVVSSAGAGVALYAACSGNESPDADVGTISSRDAQGDGTSEDAADAKRTPDASIIPDAPTIPPDASVTIDAAPDAAPDADPIG